jgi:2-alkyl-3-oxoalkanoate reductase
MTILVTGAAGFYGRYIVAEALRRGHRVRALVRPSHDAAALPWPAAARLELVRVDLRDRAALPACLAGVDVVIHAAARKGGTLHEQMEGTVRATENLLAAMEEAGVTRLVAISTFSVYAAQDLRRDSTVSETTPLEARIEERDGYAVTKTLQEQLIREHAAAKGWALTVLRPGIIFGPGETWNAWLGVQLGSRLWLQVGGMSLLPLSYVEHAADVAVLAAERDEAAGQTFNVIDDDLPTVRRYLRVLRRQQAGARIIPMPLAIMYLTARAAWLTNRYALRGKAKLPGLLVPAQVHARFKPRRYSNQKLHDRLNWQPRYSFDEALERSVNGEGERVLHE